MSDTVKEIKRYDVPAMTSPQVHQYLYDIGRSWSGAGLAMELGCWFGASSIALLQGLKNKGYNRVFWAFDRWMANQEQVEKAAAQGVKIITGEDVRPHYEKNVKQVYSAVNAVKGNLPEMLQFYHGDPVEICIFDAPKQEPVFTGCVRKLLPYFIPGVTVLGLLDYKFYQRKEGRDRERFKAPVEFMRKYGNCFAVVKEWEDECPVFFKYVKKLEI